jgi:uroporphyrinogen-III synthase
MLQHSDGNEVRRVLFPCGDQALTTLPDLLRSSGIAVDDPVIYRTESNQPPEQGVPRSGAWPLS